jgi:hypothetical protein
MLDFVRSSLHKVISTPVLDSFPPVRIPKDLARRVNVVFGEPICSKDEMERRRAAKAKLAALRNAPRKAADAERVAAPVMVYFEKDRNVRMLERIKETLDAKKIAYTLLDVAGDDSTKGFVMREARCKDDELPIVFVASAAVGGYNELTDWDVSGKLAKAIYG